MAERSITSKQLQQTVDVLTSLAANLNAARLIMSDPVAREMAGETVEAGRAALKMLRSLPNVPVQREGVPPDKEKLCLAIRQFVKLKPSGDKCRRECRLWLEIGGQSFTIGIEPMPEEEAANFAGLFVFALVGLVQQVNTHLQHD